MADNVSLNPGVGGDIVAADEISGVKYQRVKLTLGGDGVNGGDVSKTNPIPIIAPDVNYDAGGRARVSMLTSLFDGKILNGDDVFLWDQQGTGTGTFTGNKVNMAVTAGQFLVRQSKRFLPYYSGKSQFVELSFDNFANQTGVVKRVGYFSSSSSSPFNTVLDGFYLESDGVNSTYRIVCVRGGTEVINVPWNTWDNFSLISGYNWNNFTIAGFSFLWLGGACLRLYLKTDFGFIVAHTINWAGNFSDIFILSPNQPVRYEIRSTTGAGSFRAICGQVSTEGSLYEEWFNGSVTRGSSSIGVATVGTRYPVIGIRKKISARNIAVRVSGVSIFVNSADQLAWTLELNPTLSGALTFNDIANTPIQSALGNGTVTATTPGKILASGYVSQNGLIDPRQFDGDYLSHLGGTLTDVMDTMWLMAIPVSATVTVLGSMNFKSSGNV